jgi:hypothetical protein
VNNLAHELGTGVGLAGVFALVLFPMLLLSLAIPYAVLRLRDSRLEAQDPQLGLKCVLYFTHSIGVILFLTGLSLLTVDFLRDLNQVHLGGPARGFTPIQRTAAALLVAGLVVSLLHLVLIVAFTNNRRWPQTRRVFVGWRLAIHSLVLVTVFTLLVVNLFAVAPDGNTLIDLMGILGVWFPSWLIHLVLLQTYRGAGSRPPDGDRPLSVSLVD